MRLMIAVLMMQLSVSVGCCSLRGIKEGDRDFLAPPRKPTPRAQAYAHYLTALLKERQGNLDGALAEMSRAAELDPGASAPALRLVRAYLQRQDYEGALKYTERLVKLNPDNARLHILLGEMYHQIQRDEDAAKSFSKAIELEPDNEESYGALAKLLEDMNDFVATAEIYERLLQLNPESPVFHYELGVTLARMNDLEGARAALERALELKSDFVRARMLLGLVCLDSGHVEQAVLELRKYLIRRSGDRQARENLANGLARLGKYDESIEILTKIVEGPRAEAKHNLALMYVLLRAGKPKEAERYMPGKDAPFLSSFLRAVARRDRGEPVEPLLENLDRIEGDLDEDCGGALNELLYRFEKEPTAEYLLGVLDDFDARGIRSHTLLVLRARTLMIAERYDEALSVLYGIEDTFGANKNLHYYLAVTAEELGDYVEAERRLKSYLEIEPDAADVLNFLGYMYAEQNMKIDEAEQLIARALEKEPESPFYLDSMGWVYYRKGDAVKAIEYIQRAIALMDGDDAVLRDHLGDAYLLKGDTKRAIIEWKKARRLDPKLEGVQEKLDRNTAAE